MKSGNELHYAVRRDSKDQLEVVSYILDRGGQKNINHVMFSEASDRYSLGEAFGLRTPLHEEAKRGNLEVVQMLVANGADPNAKDSRGETVLQRAAYHEHNQVFKYLRSLTAVQSCSL